ncbi:MAG: polysaccharide biosynthesis protein [Oscillospiraceae bacterium]
MKLNMEVVRRMLHGKTVLVTGGVGSIGSEICRQVLAYGAKKLIIFDINENGLFYLDNQRLKGL